MRPGALGRAAPFLVLLFGVIVASSSSILVRYAQHEGVASIAIATWRMVIASLLLAPIALATRQGELVRMRLRDARIAGLAGIFLAAHFVAWISSLEYTSVASSAALVTTNPIWVGLATVFLFREPLARLTMIGIAITVAGCLMIVWVDAGIVGVAEAPGREPLLGNALALVGALGVSAYLLTGRSVARRFSLLTYITTVYGTAAAVLVCVALGAGVDMWHFSAAGWSALAALAVGPQLVGHTSFNWALRRLSPTFVALTILGEPVGSAILAGIIFTEVPSPLQAVALATLLGGIAVAALGERRTA